jgi:hypothetical protein
MRDYFPRLGGNCNGIGDIRHEMAVTPGEKRPKWVIS